MPQKLRSKIVLECQSSGSDVVEAAQEGLVLAMIEQLEKNAFLKDEHASESLIGQEGTTCIDNVDVPIHFLNDVKDFQALNEELMNQSLMTTRRLEEEWPHKPRLWLTKLELWLNKPKPWLRKPRP